MIRFFSKSLLVAVALTVAAVATAQISNFETTSIYKTATRTYCAAGDTADVYSINSVGLQWPVRFGDNDVKALQDTLLRRAFGVENLAVDDAINDYLSQPLGKDEYPLNVVASVNDDRCGLLLEQRVDVSMVGFCERYVVYSCNHYEFNGGDHPNYYTHYINYDVQRNKLLLFNDIFAPGSEEKLLEVVTQAILDKFFASSLEDLFRKSEIRYDIHVSRDIYLTGNEVVFHYNPYEIAPWSFGGIDVPVRASLLIPFFTPEALTLFDFPAGS